MADRVAAEALEPCIATEETARMEGMQDQEAMAVMEERLRSRSQDLKLFKDLDTGEENCSKKSGRKRWAVW